MSDVLFVFVREDARRAEALADVFESARLGVRSETLSEAALEASAAAVILWSAKAIRSQAFLIAVERALAAGKAMFACFGPPPPPEVAGEAAVFDLSAWRGKREGEAIDAMVLALNYLSARRADAPNDEEKALAAGWTSDLPTTPPPRENTTVMPLRLIAIGEMA